MGRHDGKGNVAMVDVLDTDPKHIDHYITTSRAYSTEAVPQLLDLLGDAPMLEPKKSKVTLVAGADPKAKRSEFKNLIRCAVFKSARFDREVLASLARMPELAIIEMYSRSHSRSAWTQGFLRFTHRRMNR